MVLPRVRMRVRRYESANVSRISFPFHRVCNINRTVTNGGTHNGHDNEDEKY